MIMVPYRSTRPLQGFGALGCACLPARGMGALSGPVVTIGPIAAQMLAERRRGIPAKIALDHAMATLARQGEKTVTPAIQLQLAAGLQLGSGLSGLGALGAGAASAAFKSGATAASIAPVAASTLGIGSAIAIGQTAIPIPVVGAVIGAVVGATIMLTRRHVGKAEAAWNNPGFYAALRTTNGRDFNERQWAEALKGMFDTGNNILPVCGPDRHKNPDCFTKPLSEIIVQGYLSGAVPLSATTQQVYDTVVVPWLQQGGGGMVWSQLSREPIQQLMIKSAVDRYLAGQPITRADMDSYKGDSGYSGYHTPSLQQALQPLLNPQSASSPVSPSSPLPVQSAPIPGTVQPAITNAPLQVLGQTSAGTAIVPVDQTASLMQQMMAQGASQNAALQAAIASLQAQGVNTNTPQMQQQLAADVALTKPHAATAGIGGISMPILATLAGAAAISFALARPQKRGRH